MVGKNSSDSGHTSKNRSSSPDSQNLEASPHVDNNPKKRGRSQLKSRQNDEARFNKPRLKVDCSSRDEPIRGDYTVLGNSVNEADETEIRENEEGKLHERNGIPEENSVENKVNEAGEAEIQNEGNRGSSKQSDLFKKLADSVLGREPMLGKDESNAVPKQTPWDPNQSTLPKKFRFEDEVPKQVEKTDSEIELKEMFALHDFCRSLPDSFDHSKVAQERENSPVGGETEDPPCQHEFVIRENEGKICRKCDHVAVAAKNIIPDWAEKPPRESNNERSPRREEDRSQFDELHLPYSTNNNAAFNCNNGTVWNIKPGVRESMYKHQQEGFEFLWMNLAGSINLADLKSSIVPTTDVGGCIISHVPGTGKTCLTIVFIETYLKVFPNCRPVIVATAERSLLVD